MSLHVIAHLHGLAAHALPEHGFSLDGLGFGFKNGKFKLRPNQLTDVAVVAAILLLPLAVWIAKLWMDRWEKSQQREHARAFVMDVAVTLAKSIQLCDGVRSAIQAGGRVPDDTVEAAIESLDASRQRLRLYLRRHIPLHELIPLAAAAEKQLGEGCEAMATLHGPPGGGPDRELTYARQLQTVRDELQSVADRLRGLQPDLGRAIAKVDAGWALTD
jgi:hypothetical protein